jgi:hypothetical protein
MAFTVNDFQDLLRLLDQHPEWRDELRRRLLPDDLLGLPAIVREIADALKALTARVDALAEAQVRTEQRVGALVEAQLRTERRVDTLAERLDALTERVDRIAALLEALTARVDALTAQVGVLAVRVGWLDGEALQTRYLRQAGAYLGRLARRVRVIENTLLLDLLDDAVDQGRLTEAERDEVLLADMVVPGRRRPDGTEAYYVVEVSSVIDDHDVRRAINRAGLLARLGRPAVPVVAGRAIVPEAAAYAQTNGVAQVLDGRTTGGVASDE